LLFSGEVGSARLVAKSDGVLAGIDTAVRVFRALDSGADCEVLFRDGDSLKTGDVIARVSGNAASLLKAERTALNLLQHMSGIASLTRRYVDAVAGASAGGAAIADTRKTLPGLRALQKYSVLCGGGSNHRFNLSQSAMLKDNHIDAFGGVAEAVAALRERAGHMVLIEVEVRDLQQLVQAIDARADVVLLDNMGIDAMREAVEITKRRVKPPLLEASGNITLKNVRAVAETGVDIISVGALTHSVSALDISLKWD
jgi:nicotinate-nucleotide pyrophosphorylase (carboxylating)